MSVTALLLIPLLTTPSPQEPARDLNGARAALLAGVDAVERVGVPGQIAILGPDAFGVVVGAGPRDMPFVAAAAASDGGRVVALAHDGYPTLDADARPGATRLVENALAWLAGGASDAPIRVGLLRRDPALARALDERGHTAAVLDAAMLDAGAADVVLWRGGHDVEPEMRAALDRFLARGGGLLVAVCPWGWEQVSRGKTLLADLAPNDLLAPRGLAFARGTVSPGDDGTFATNAREMRGDAFGALRALQASGTTESAYAVEHALRNAPASARTFHALVDEVLDAKILAEAAPSPERSLRAREAQARLAATRAVLQWRAEGRAVGAGDTAVTIAPAADAFPGAVPDDAPREVATLSLRAGIPGWRSTGLYLPPGGVVHAAVAGDASGWRLRVGAHKDGLWQKDRWRRWPEITDEVAFADATAHLGSAFGGAVFLVADDDAQAITVTIEGCVRAPFFDLSDPTSAARWHGEREHPAPWAELAGRHLVMSVPSRSVRALQDPAALMRYWDAVMAAECELGAEPIPARPERFVADVQISAGYMHAGYPIMTHLDVAEPGGIQLDLARLLAEGTWGHFHELGHNRQKGAWTFGGTGEVTCNLFSLYAAEAMCDIAPWEHPWLAGQKEAARAYLDAPDFDGVWRKKPGVALVTYAELQREFGWEPFRAAFATYHDAPAPKGDDAEIATWVARISRACERDLRPFFRRWGWPIAAELASDGELDALPAWSGADPAKDW